MNSASSKPKEIKSKTTIFAVRTTIGQEKSVLQNIFNRLRILNPFPDLKALMIAQELRGFLFIEATHQRDVMITIAGMRHIKGKIVGSISLDEISHVISPRKVTEILEEGDIVEIVSGVFDGQKAEVIRMPKDTAASQDVTVRLIDSDSAISIKIHGDFLKLIQKGEKQKEIYELKEMETNHAVTKPIGEKEAPGEKKTPSIVGTSPLGSVSASDEDVFSFGDSSKDDDDYVDEEESEEKVEEEDDEEEDEWAKFGF
jgi:transcription elongation factor Spt5